MQIFFDSGAKFHEFPLRCGIAEESLTYEKITKRNNKAAHMLHAYSLEKTHILSYFKMKVLLNKLGRVPALVSMVERIG